ncbi:hypothetical protein LTR91_025381 [Friedmanniomyces endolithicus]|uniref:Uncharacterized protein n=1 Tax=Friedmanniomyces endolithicus TaxID=329885 RepID=A0AAN6GZ86_9PEZI|nr:hypothetical protein LTR94_023005 [Friedmanniomyces endolithicus]KAK0768254.1 hypothetical protein LTR59_017799 [Friedmanniomyces endolithicus]KAK0771381.1 hypothetical protein LTR75_017679 [Friedmanniomyces endolithicus]KAK0824655.1 hypothetical protein LTR03_017669 [Friedmanniomyces endolithicus]KAK0837232.1 hypothetical protein LTS02_017999 [Friedmanniomyces endolithicus]
MLHIFTILPAAFLVVFQFTPAVRHAAILFHRINGYLIITLSLISSAGVLIIAKHAFGGDMATRTWSGALVTSTTIAYVMAYINIKLLQIDQHRAWMMRAWAYFSTIITIRLIMFISANIISTMNGWYVTRPCAQIGSIFGPHHTVAVYPECQAYFNGTNPQQVAIVVASMSNGNPISIAATLGVSFGSAGWLAFWIHAVLIEIYLRLTPIESERLRQVSYERQLARRFKRPGYAGLVAERIGDSKPFVPDGNTHHLGHEDVAMDSLP